LVYIKLPDEKKMTALILFVVWVLLGAIVAAWIACGSGPRSDYERYLEDNQQMKGQKQ